MQREKRLGLKVNNELFQEGDSKKGLPKVLMQRSKLNIYLPQPDRDSTSTKSSRNDLNMLLFHFRLATSFFVLLLTTVPNNTGDLFSEDL